MRSHWKVLRQYMARSVITSDVGQCWRAARVESERLVSSARGENWGGEKPSESGLLWRFAGAWELSEKEEESDNSKIWGRRKWKNRVVAIYRDGTTGGRAGLGQRKSQELGFDASRLRCQRDMPQSSWIWGFIRNIYQSGVHWRGPSWRSRFWSLQHIKDV